MQLSKFIAARNRICETSRCFTCPLGRNKSGVNTDCRNLILNHPETAETIVKDWLKSHKEGTTNE